MRLTRISYFWSTFFVFFVSLFKKPEFQVTDPFKSLLFTFRPQPEQWQARSSISSFLLSHCWMEQMNIKDLSPFPPPPSPHTNLGSNVNHLITCTLVFPSGCDWWSCCSWYTCSGRCLCETWAPHPRMMPVHCWVGTEVCPFDPLQSFSLLRPVPGTLNYECICGTNDRRWMSNALHTWTK